MGIFTNLPTSLFHIKTWGGALLQGWKDRNWSKAVEVAIAKALNNQVSTKKLTNWNVDRDPKIKGGKSSLAKKVSIKILEWKKV